MARPSLAHTIGIRNSGRRRVVLGQQGADQLRNGHDLRRPMGVVAGEGEAVGHLAALGIDEGECDAVGAVGVIAGDDAMVGQVKGIFFPALTSSRNWFRMARPGMPTGLAMITRSSGVARR